MGARNWIAVNKSGSSFPVKYWSTKQTIGTISAREVFAIYGADEGDTYSVKFRNSSGEITDGYVQDGGVYSRVAYVSDYPNSTNDFWDYLSKSYQKHDIYSVRNALTVYDSSGAVWGNVAAGQYVAAKQSYQSNNGQNNPTWLQINYVKSSAGVWTSINNSFGFVPMLSVGSTYSNIAVYGTW